MSEAHKESCIMWETHKDCSCGLTNREMIAAAHPPSEGWEKEFDKRFHVGPYGFNRADDLEADEVKFFITSQKAVWERRERERILKVIDIHLQAEKDQIIRGEIKSIVVDIVPFSDLSLTPEPKEKNL